MTVMRFPNYWAVTCLAFLVHAQQICHATDSYLLGEQETTISSQPRHQYSLEESFIHSDRNDHLRGPDTSSLFTQSRRLADNRNGTVPFEDISPLYLMLGLLSIIATALVSWLFWTTPALQGDHASTMIHIITLCDLAYTLKFTFSAFFFELDVGNERDSFHIINDNCGSSALYEQFFGMAVIAWNACWIYDFICILNNPLRNTQSNRRFYHAFVWPLCALLCGLTYVTDVHERTSDHICWIRADTSHFWTFDLELYIFILVAVGSLIYASIRLNTGTRATHQLRVRMLRRHAAYVIAFLTLWLWPATHYFWDKEDRNLPITIIDAIATAGQAVIFAAIRLSEPGAWSLLLVRIRAMKGETHDTRLMNQSPNSALLLDVWRNKPWYSRIWYKMTHCCRKLNRHSSNFPTSQSSPHGYGTLQNYYTPHSSTSAPVAMNPLRTKSAHPEMVGICNPMADLEQAYDTEVNEIGRRRTRSHSMSEAESPRRLSNVSLHSHNQSIDERIHRDSISHRSIMSQQSSMNLNRDRRSSFERLRIMWQDAQGLQRKGSQQEGLLNEELQKGSQGGVQNQCITHDTPLSLPKPHVITSFPPSDIDLRGFDLNHQVSQSSLGLPLPSTSLDGRLGEESKFETNSHCAYDSDHIGTPSSSRNKRKKSRGKVSQFFHGLLGDSKPIFGDINQHSPTASESLRQPLLSPLPSPHIRRTTPLIGHLAASTTHAQIENQHPLISELPPTEEIHVSGKFWTPRHVKLDSIRSDATGWDIGAGLRMELGMCMLSGLCQALLRYEMRRSTHLQGTAAPGLYPPSNSIQDEEDTGNATDLFLQNSTLQRRQGINDGLNKTHRRDLHAMLNTETDNESVVSYSDEPHTTPAYATRFGTRQNERMNERQNERMNDKRYTTTHPIGTNQANISSTPELGHLVREWNSKYHSTGTNPQYHVRLLKNDHGDSMDHSGLPYKASWSSLMNPLDSTSNTSEGTEISSPKATKSSRKKLPRAGAAVARFESLLRNAATASVEELKNTVQTKTPTTPHCTARDLLRANSTRIYELTMLTDFELHRDDTVKETLTDQRIRTPSPENVDIPMTEPHASMQSNEASLQYTPVQMHRRSMDNGHINHDTNNTKTNLHQRNNTIETHMKPESQTSTIMPSTRDKSASVDQITLLDHDASMHAVNHPPQDEHATSSHFALSSHFASSNPLASSSQLRMNHRDTSSIHDEEESVMSGIQLSDTHENTSVSSDGSISNTSMQDHTPNIDHIHGTLGQNPQRNQAVSNTHSIPRASSVGTALSERGFQHGTLAKPRHKGSLLIDAYRNANISHVSSRQQQQKQQQQQQRQQQQQQRHGTPIPPTPPLSSAMYNFGTDDSSCRSAQRTRSSSLDTPPDASTLMPNSFFRINSPLRQNMIQNQQFIPQHSNRVNHPSNIQQQSLSCMRTHRYTPMRHQDSSASMSSSHVSKESHPDHISLPASPCLTPNSHHTKHTSIGNLSSRNVGPYTAETVPGKYASPGGIRKDTDAASSHSGISTTYQYDTFQLAAFAESAFGRLRSAAGITVDHVVRVLDPHFLRSGHLKAHFSEGASSSFFCRSTDQVLMVKTISRDELETLMQLLPAYITHLRRYPNSLLCRYYGCFGLKPHRGNRVYFLLMGNAFPCVHASSRFETFDLKGSTIGRRKRVSHSVEIAGGKKSIHKRILYQDQDFRRCFPLGLPIANSALKCTSSNTTVCTPSSLNTYDTRQTSNLLDNIPTSSQSNQSMEDTSMSHATGTHVTPQQLLSNFSQHALFEMDDTSIASCLVEQLERDCDLLRRHGLMDYSLLVQLIPIDASHSDIAEMVQQNGLITSQKSLPISMKGIHHIYSQSARHILETLHQTSVANIDSSIQTSHGLPQDTLSTMPKDVSKYSSNASNTFDQESSMKSNGMTEQTNLDVPGTSARRPSLSASMNPIRNTITSARRPSFSAGKELLARISAESHGTNHVHTPARTHRPSPLVHSIRVGKTVSQPSHLQEIQSIEQPPMSICKKPSSLQLPPQQQPQPQSEQQSEQQMNLNLEQTKLETDTQDIHQGIPTSMSNITKNQDIDAFTGLNTSSDMNRQNVSNVKSASNNTCRHDTQSDISNTLTPWSTLAIIPVHFYRHESAKEAMEHDDQCNTPTQSNLNNAMNSSSPHYNSIKRQDESNQYSHRISEKENTVGQTQYALVQIGVIDMLQRYDLSKRMEKGFKMLRHASWNVDVSSVDPDRYADRFISLARYIFQPKTPVIRPEIADLVEAMEKNHFHTRKYRENE